MTRTLCYAFYNFRALPQCGRTSSFVTCTSEVFFDCFRYSGVIKISQLSMDYALCRPTHFPCGPSRHLQPCIKIVIMNIICYIIVFILIINILICILLCYCFCEKLILLMTGLILPTFFSLLLILGN